MLKLFELLRVFHLYHKISQTYMKSTISVYFGLHLILFMPVETYFMSEEYLIFFFSSNHDTGDTNSLDVKKKLWKLSKQWKIVKSVKNADFSLKQWKPVNRVIKIICIGPHTGERKKLFNTLLKKLWFCHNKDNSYGVLTCLNIVVK